MKRFVCIVFILLPMGLFGDPGSWRALGNPGDWVLTIAGVNIGDKLYTAESSGYLYVTDLRTGRWSEISPGYGSTTFMFTDQQWLYTIESDGSLYRVSPQDGSWEQLGSSGEWVRTLAGALIDGKLYTAESSGYLYETNLRTGRRRELNAGYGQTKFMFAQGGMLYTIETDGSLYRVSPQDGSWAQVGASGDWVLTLAGVVVGDRLYTTESSGYLYWTDLSTGRWEEVAAQYENTTYMFANGHVIYTIERNGSLYEVQTR